MIKKIILGLVLSLSMISPSLAQTCDPSAPSVAQVEETFKSNKELKVETIEGDEIKFLREAITKTTGIPAEGLFEFDKHIYAFTDTNDIGLAVLINDGCVVRFSPIPVEKYKEFKELMKGV